MLIIPVSTKGRVAVAAAVVDLDQATDAWSHGFGWMMAVRGGAKMVPASSANPASVWTIPVSIKTSLGSVSITSEQPAVDVRQDGET